MSKEVYGKIANVLEGSPAWEIGILPGDELVSINSQPVRDMLEYRYLAADESLDIHVLREGRILSFAINKDMDEDLGIEFEEELFDGLHICRNNCIFCFLRQMPKGMRSSLYVRDDDYRLSLAHGNYITLSNVTDDDLDRICSQRMSPLYISVHTTDPELRTSMLRNKNAGRIMDQLKRLAESRITMHTQIVLCPGMNDGEHLERTIRDLSSLHPWVSDIAIVPVGLTKHRDGLAPLQSVDPSLAGEIIPLCISKQKEFMDRFGTRLVFPSDELYILSGTEIPDTEAYEGFPQLEDGIGVTRIFLDELEQARRMMRNTPLRPGKYVLVTGTLAAPMVQRLADTLNRIDGITAKICTIKNKFLGETVTVTGLLTGQDIAEQLKCIAKESEVLIPDVMLKDGRFLDDMTPSEIEASLGIKIAAVPASPLAVVERLSADLKFPVSCTACAGR